ncbi:MAG: glycerophosphodiester phosphodiesterase [Gemmatimonadales bacterium]|nr:MAG: glycerophosphodiester phosphodiesterase [Gemmatimonadales bacterium]
MVRLSTYVVPAVAIALLVGLTPPAPGPAMASSDAIPLIIAHRGASGHAPEHTLPAYDLAVEMGAHVLEPDLQMTRDGVLIAFHDATLDRTARGPSEFCTGPVRERTLAEIRECDVGSWFNERFPERADPSFEGLRVVTLDELFQRYGHQVRWYPETKQPEENPGMEEALVELIHRHGLRDAAAERGQVLIQSFDPASLERLRELDPDLPLVQLLPRQALDNRTAWEVLEAISHYARGVGPNHTLVDEAFMAAAREWGLFVHPWTVNDPTTMDRLLALEVDGIFTDFPDVLAQRIAGASPAR